MGMPFFSSGTNNSVVALTIFSVLLLLQGCLEQGAAVSEKADLGPRPGYLVNAMSPSALKTQLQRCEKGPFYRSSFSIGHRGAPMMFPEHTEQSYRAAASMGAGVLECDVTFTKDAQLVCRHAQCDLHTTTNIIETPLNSACTVPWNKDKPNPDTVKCCASDLTLAEFKTLKGKMDASNRRAATAKEFMGGTADWRTDLYIANGKLLSHKESIALFKSLGVQFTPELKGGDKAAALQVEDVFGSQSDYARAMINDYIEAGINPEKVWPQSFNPQDILVWIQAYPAFGAQSVMLDGRNDINIDDPSSFKPTMQHLAQQGVKIIAPPLWMLLSVTDNGDIVPSAYASAAKAAGLDIITWTFERSDLRNGSRTGFDSNGNVVMDWYYQFDKNSSIQAIKTDGDMYKVLDVLAKQVGIIGVFSDWPATVTYYANCMGLE